jgi:hypothetical protein
MGTTVSIREVVDAFETASDEMSSYVSRATGQVLTVTHEDLRLAEEDPGPEMPAWQREAVTEAKRILDSDEWLELPNKFDIHEWEIMDQFGRSLAADSERSAVADAIQGSGAFRKFKAIIRRLGIEDAWLAYKTLALETIAREWLAQNDLLPNQALQADGSSVAPLPHLLAAERQYRTSARRRWPTSPISVLMLGPLDGYRRSSRIHRDGNEGNWDR